MLDSLDACGVPNTNTEQPDSFETSSSARQHCSDRNGSSTDRWEGKSTTPVMGTGSHARATEPKPPRSRVAAARAKSVGGGGHGDDMIRAKEDAKAHQRAMTFATKAATKLAAMAAPISLARMDPLYAEHVPAYARGPLDTIMTQVEKMRQEATTIVTERAKGSMCKFDDFQLKEIQKASADAVGLVNSMLTTARAHAQQ